MAPQGGWRRRVREKLLVCHKARWQLSLLARKVKPVVDSRVALGRERGEKISNPSKGSWQYASGSVVRRVSDTRKGKQTDYKKEKKKIYRNARVLWLHLCIVMVRAAMCVRVSLDARARRGWLASPVCLWLSLSPFGSVLMWSGWSWRRFGLSLSLNLGLGLGLRRQIKRLKVGRVALWECKSSVLCIPADQSNTDLSCYCPSCPLGLLSPRQRHSRDQPSRHRGK